MENRPKDIPASHFKDLLEYWNSDAAKKTSETNIENQKKLKHPHTAGKASFARIIEAETERIQSTQKSGDGSDSVDVFALVMGPEHPGRVRLYGRGVNKNVLKKKKGYFGSSVNATDERMEQKMEEM